MRFLILFSTFILVKSAPHSLEEEELPFSTDNFPTLLDEANSSSGEEKDELAISYSDQADVLKKRMKMKSMFNTNGPPAIGTDLFSNAAVEENVKSKLFTQFPILIHVELNFFSELSYEGSGEGVDENEPSTTIDYFNIGNSSAVEDAVVESSSNSSTLYDHNTSDAQVETVSDTLYQKTEAEVNAILHTSESKYGGEKEDEAVEEGTKMTTVLDVQDYSGNDTDSKVECAAPPVCGKNCFVTINDKGCQDCQCLWIAQDCEIDKDCTEKNQYCDLGKCNCQPGYQQNMRKSGVCEVESDSKQGLIPPPGSTNSREVEENEITKKKLKRNKRSSKPRLSERLEWPDEEDESRSVSFDTDQIMEPTTQSTLPIPSEPIIITATEASRRGMARFVSEDFAKQLQRTTAKVKKYDWFPPTTTSTAPTTQFSMTTRPVPTAPPLTVDQFFIIETTVSPSPIPPTPRKIEDDHKMEYMKERKPNFLGVKEEVQELEYPVSSQSHIKKIHLEMPPSLLPHRRKPKKMKTTTATPDDASEVEEMKLFYLIFVISILVLFSSVDEIEFPISSKIKNGFKKPRALSAEPTREELKDHKSLVDLFNSHAARGFEKNTDDVKPSFQILQSFTSSSPEPTPEIQVSLASEGFGKQFSPIPDLPNEGKIITERKPWMIQQGKIYNIPPLSNISEDMASDDPPEVTPEPAPFQQHQMGVWYPMKKGDIPHLGIFSGEFRRSPVNKIRTTDDFRLYNEYTKANRFNRPIRIEMDNAGGKRPSSIISNVYFVDHMRNECRDDRNCGNQTVCCTKRWCDRTNNCGLGKFCLTSCASSKLTFLPSSNHAESVIDIMYD
ncbi:hypothetical protein CRE_00356 [Caenorhabditis remanei]|uniref:Uncharacterized protein n=1 Tax=Caenorhabditis remanei TaxID=31234 RepID=E3LEP9_CAERE|nr:hypothetical protein CRE_00356 [Caenorhabditis remanei]